MTTPALPSTPPRTYAELRRRVERVVFTGRRRIERAWLETYHDTGWLIREHILLNEDRAEYGARVFIRLAADTGISKRTLHECDLLYRRFPIVRHGAQLGWSRYRALSQIEDAGAREKLLQQTLEHGWTSPQLIERVRAFNAAAAEGDEPAESGALAPAQVALLKPKRGTPGLYPVVAHSDGLALDLGFKVYLPLEGIPGQSLRSVKAGDIARVDNENALARDADATKPDLYTYRTRDVRVVDGDTLAVTIDLPPFNRLDKKLRLRGLNCPEMDTEAGRAAKRFVQSLIDAASAVVITTTKPDKYDRYLGDVFLISPGGGEPVFLNNALLTAGHAVRMDTSTPPPVDGAFV